MSFAKTIIGDTVDMDDEEYEDEEVLQELRSLSADAQALIKSYNDAATVLRWSDINASDKKKVATEYAATFQAYLEAGGDLNIRPPTQYMSHAPIWYASLCLIEKTMDGSNSLEARLKAFDAIWPVLVKHELDFALYDVRCLTASAAHAHHWGTAYRLAAIDPNLTESKISIFSDSVVCTSQAKRNAMVLEVMDHFFKYDTRVDFPSSMAGITPLMRAAAYSNVEQCEWLLAHGADVNMRDHRQHATPIMHALVSRFGLGDYNTRKRARKVVELLLAHGADITLRPTTLENFGTLVKTCKTLKGEDQRAVKAIWERAVAANPALEQLSPVGVFTLDGVVTPAEIASLNRQTDLLLLPNRYLYSTLVEFLMDKGVRRFTVTDAATLLRRNWNGIDKSFFLKSFGPREVEHQLNVLISGARWLAQANLTRDMKTGEYIILSDHGEEENIVATI